MINNCFTLCKKWILKKLLGIYLHELFSIVFLPQIFWFFVINCLLRSWTTSLKEVQNFDTCTPSIWIKVLWAYGNRWKGHFSNWVSQCFNHCDCGTISPYCNKIVKNMLELFWMVQFHQMLGTVHQSQLLGNLYDMDLLKIEIPYEIDIYHWCPMSYLAIILQNRVLLDNGRQVSEQNMF